MSWETTGNAGTDPANDFVGTTDQQPLILRTNGGEALRINPDGRVGLGTTAPASQMEIVGNWNDGQLGALKLTGDKPSIKFAGGAPAGNESWALHLGSRGPGNLEFLRQTGPLAFDHVLALTPTGRVGIGTSTPSSKLEVLADTGIGVLGRGTQNSGVVGLHGDPRLQETQVPSGQAGVFGASDVGSGVVAYTRNRQVPAIFAQGGLRSFASLNAFAGIFDGNVQVNGDIFVPGADCAEHFDVAAGQQIEAGSVVVIHQDGSLRTTERAYDKKVAGVISGAGAFRPALVLDKQESDLNRQPVALIGKVYCKVDAQYSPIGFGDMLTSSPTPGHAMKVTDSSKAIGAVLGKALGSLDEGTGELPILVCLQ